MKRINEKVDFMVYKRKDNVIDNKDIGNFK